MRVESAFAPLLHGFHTTEKVKHTRNPQPVEHLRTPFLILDNPDILKLAQMARDRGHLHPNHIGQLGHAPFASGKLIHDKETGRMGQGFNDPGFGFVFRLGSRSHATLLQLANPLIDASIV
jgi:hypothetical protein